MKLTNKKVAIIASMLAISMSFSGCLGLSKSKLEPTAFPVTVENIQVDNAPNKIASISPAITQMLIELGYQDKIVGYPSDYTGKGVVQGENQIGTPLELDLKKVGELAPEIVFTTVSLPKSTVEKLAKVNIRLLTLPSATTVEQVKQRYIDISTVMGGQFDGETIGKKVGAEIDLQLSAITAALPAKKSFLYVASLDPVVAGDNTIQGAIVSTLGNNVASGIAGYTATAEQIAALSPDIIIYSNSIDPAKLIESEIFSSMAAVQGNAIFAVDDSEMSLASNSFIKVVLKLANTIYTGTDFTPKAVVSDTVSE